MTGEARYLKTGEAAADVGERAYWNYEMQMKRLETQLGSMVGGDGAIYAIRRSLWQTLPDDAINDFLNPLQIVAAGWRGVYEPDAVCWEETGGSTKRSEYKRRVRIVSRSWRAVFQARRGAQPVQGRPLRLVAVVPQGPALDLGLVRVGFVVGSAQPACWFRLFGRTGRRSSPSALSAASSTAAIRAPADGACDPAGYFLAHQRRVDGRHLREGTLGRVSGVWSPPRAQAGSRRRATV